MALVELSKSLDQKDLQFLTDKLKNYLFEMDLLNQISKSKNLENGLDTNFQIQTIFGIQIGRMILLLVKI